MKISIIFDHSDNVLHFAAKELKHFFDEMSGSLIEFNPANDIARDWEFILASDARMKEGAFSVKHKFGGTTHTVRLAGRDPGCVTHAVYEALEKIGVYFEVTGYVLPDKFSLDPLVGTGITVVPFAKIRSIKHYINFAVDISSFSQDDARNVLLNQARLKYNAVSFQLFQGMWFPQENDPAGLLAGNFFYSSKHVIPDVPLIRDNNVNRRVHCIPEIEEVVEDTRKRSNFAMRWLRDLIGYARSIGLQVIGVVELDGSTPEQNAETCKHIIDAFPGITTFEIITPECGGAQVSQTAAEEEAHLREVFKDEELVANPRVKAAFKDRLRQFHGVVLYLRKALDVMPLITPYLKERRIAFAMGSYSKCPGTVITSIEILRKYLPAEYMKTYLIQYGSCKVNTQLDTVSFSAEDWTDSLLTNWFEFDGSIYVVQKAMYGIWHAIEKAAAAVGPDGRIQGMNILTWRVAENKLSVKYVSRALIDPAVTPERFMKDYCGRFGISNASAFIKMIKRVEEAENFVNYKMFNIAFCMPNLCFGGPGITSLPRYAKDDFMHIIGEYDAIANQCEALLAKTSNRVAIRYLRMFHSRVRASTWHLRGTYAISALGPICEGKTHADLTAAEKARVVKISDEALAYTEKYLETIAEDMPDRGSQGLMISYYLNFPAYYHYLKTCYTVGADIAAYRTGPYSAIGDQSGIGGPGLVCPVPYV